MLGDRVRIGRENCGLSREALGEPELSGSYIEALECDAVVPSPLTLELIAKRLRTLPAILLDGASERQPGGIPGRAKTPSSTDLNVKAYEEDLHYQLDTATAMIHSRPTQIAEALRLISTAEAIVSPFVERLHVRARYRVPYLRGMAYLQIGKAGMAQAHLETALDLVTLAGAGVEDLRPPTAFMGVHVGAGGKHRGAIRYIAAVRRPNVKRGEKERDGCGEIEARVRNLLGVAYYMQRQLRIAEEQHLRCLHAAQDKQIKDPNLKFSIYRNLANDYWAAGKYKQSVTIYKEALHLFQDLYDPVRLAALHWGLALSYKAQGDRPFAKLHSQKALQVYRAHNLPTPAATVAINLAEVLLEDGQYGEATKLLNEAEALLLQYKAGESLQQRAIAVGSLSEGTADPLVLSDLYQNRARLAHKEGRLEEAARYAKDSIELAEGVYSKVAADTEEASTYPVHYYAQALHTGAWIEEALGNRELADRLVARALSIVEDTGFERVREAIMRSYAMALKNRGDFEGAVHYLELGAQIRIDAN